MEPCDDVICTNKGSEMEVSQGVWIRLGNWEMAVGKDSEKDHCGLDVCEDGENNCWR